MRFGITTICLLLFLALPAFGVSGEKLSDEDGKKKIETFQTALKGTSVTDLVSGLSGLTAAQRAELPPNELFNALVRLPASVRQEILTKEPVLTGLLPREQQQSLVIADLRATGQAGPLLGSQGQGQGGQAQPASPSPSPSPSPAATPPTAQAPAATDSSKSDGDKKTAKIEVPQPGAVQKNTFLEAALANTQKETDISVIAGAIAAINQGVSAKMLSEIAAQAQAGGASQNAILQILQIGKTNLGNAQLAGTNSGTSGGSSSKGYGVATSSRLLNSLDAPTRAVAAPKQKPVPQFLDQTYARGVAAANQEPASTEGGRVWVIEGGYGGGSGGEDGNTINLRSGSGIAPASGHRGAGQ